MPVMMMMMMIMMMIMMIIIPFVGHKFNGNLQNASSFTYNQYEYHATSANKGKPAPKGCRRQAGTQVISTLCNINYLLFIYHLIERDMQFTFLSLT